MKVIITATPVFERSLKRLAKHCPSIKDDYAALLKNLEAHPDTGTRLGGRMRKVRMPIASKAKGKSGGARVITYTLEIRGDNTTDIKLVYIYDKSERATLTDKELKTLIEMCGL